MFLPSPGLCLFLGDIEFFDGISNHCSVFSFRFSSEPFDGFAGTRGPSAPRKVLHRATRCLSFSPAQLLPLAIREYEEGIFNERGIGEFCVETKER